MRIYRVPSKSYYRDSNISDHEYQRCKLRKKFFEVKTKKELSAIDNESNSVNKQCNLVDRERHNR